MRLGGRIAAAAEVLADMDARRRPAADALKDWGLSHRFAGSGDRSAIGNLVYDVLRRRRSLAWRMGDDGRETLVIGAVLAVGRDLSALAAELAGDRHAPALPSAKALERFATADLAEAPDAIRADVPDWLAGPLAASLGPDWVAEVAALSDRPPLDMRANVLKASRDGVVAALAPFGAESTTIAPHGIRIPPIAGDGRHPNVQVERAFQLGEFEIQDEGSQIVAALCGAAPGETVLDYCAGAGGKTLALAAEMRGEGTVHAFDADRQRLAPIFDRLARAGVSNALVHSPRDDLSPFHDRMDRVVVDAPCTGTGTWRRRPDAKWRLGERQVARRMEEQDRVLDAAARFIRPGGRLLFITCSVLEAENGERVEAFCARNPGFSMLDAKAIFAERFPGMASPYIQRDTAGGASITLTPLRTGTDGFFFAALERRA